MSSNVISIEALRTDTVRRFAPIEIELDKDTTVELKALLKLTKKDRETVLDLIKDLNNIEDDEGDDESAAEWSEAVVEAASKIFRLLTPAHKKLIAKLDHEDPAVKASLFAAVLNQWAGESNLSGK